MPQTETWAVVDSSGRKICDYDTVDQLEDSNTASIPIEPQENGGLFAYDKVPTPIEVTVRLLFSGDYTRQNAALALLEKYRRYNDIHDRDAFKSVFQYDACRVQHDSFSY